MPEDAPAACRELKIFLSYRRADAADVAGRMYDWLVMTFRPEHVFKDVDSIPPGADFADVIGRKIAGCDVVIVIIGRTWATVEGHDGQPRLYAPDDLVRIEVEQSLRCNIPVIPALVSHAAMPAAAALPESIRRITRLNASLIRPDPDFRGDMGRLIRSLQTLAAAPSPATLPNRSPSATPPSRTMASTLTARAPDEREARRLWDAAVAHRAAGRLAEAIADYTRLIGLPGARASLLTRALVNRGIANGAWGRPADEIADYTRVIGMPDAPADQVAKALYYRGITQGRQGKMAEAMADYRQFVDMAGAPADQVAKVLLYCGIVNGEQGRPAEAIADYTRLVDMAGAPADQVAMALVNRGIALGKQGRPAEAIADFTRAIGTPGAPAKDVALALLNRGSIFGSQGKIGSALSDYDSVSRLEDAPPELKAKAVERGGMRLGPTRTSEY